MSDDRSDAEVLDIINGHRARRRKLAEKYGTTSADNTIDLNAFDRSLRNAKVRGVLEEMIAQLADSHRRACRVRDVCGTCRIIREALALLVDADEIDVAEEAVWKRTASQGGSPNA